ncbi:IclR family transcriptional regulator [Arthrobacter sp. NPDC058097]|uniref:IclR family transcriptional regulator n=1 Tax=Arthrobacter sp. NPDC058097 TaxID=3346340 RepID=UPI0036D7B1D5
MLDRIVEILDVFRSAGGPLTASQIARRTGIPMASTHRLVGEMVRTGILGKDEERRLSIGMRLWEATARSSAVQALRESALPHMQRLMEKIHAPTLLCVLDGNEVINVETLTPRGIAAANVTKPGIRLPALASSPGVAMLAFADQQACSDVLTTANLTGFTPHTPTDPAAIRKLLDDTRRMGYVVARGWMWRDSTGIAVPVLGSDALAVASLSVTVPIDFAQPTEVAAMLQASARAISWTGRTREEPVNSDLAELKYQLKRATERQKIPAKREERW